MVEVVGRIKKIGKPIVLYGSGGQGQRVESFLKKRGIEIECYCETSKREGEAYRGDKKIYSYDELKNRYDEYVLLLSTIPTTAKNILEFLEEKEEKNDIIPFSMPFKINNEFLENADMIFDELINQKFFEDQESIEILKKSLNYKMTGDGLALLEMASGNSFFDEDSLLEETFDVLIDIGAFTGDTIIKFLQKNGLYYHRIIAAEMDFDNFTALQSVVKNVKLQNVDLIHTAISDTKKSVKFYSVDKGTFFNANLYEEADNVSSQEEEERVQNERNCTLNTIKTMTLDEIYEMEKQYLAGQNVVMKLNIMCHELNALRGAKKLMREIRPTLITEYGSEFHQLLEIPKLIRRYNENYRFYLRQKKVFDDCKTVLYCIPEDKNEICQLDL